MMSPTSFDWENPAAAELRRWGEAFARRVLIECTAFRGAKVKTWVLQDEELKRRIEVLDQTSQKQIDQFLNILGPVIDEEQSAKELASSLVRAFEYRHFHDVLQELEAVGDDADRLKDALVRLGEWKVLESRAVLEVIKGRLEIIDKLRAMVINDAPETAHRAGDENLHDLLASFPWLLNPEWQVLVEERTVTKQLREWGDNDISGEDRGRFDFLGMTGSGLHVVIEIKRPGHAITLKELQRAEDYTERLRSGTSQEMFTVVICGTGEGVSQTILDRWDKDPHLEIRRWAALCDRTRLQYERHRDILEGNAAGDAFGAAGREVLESRRVAADGAFRGVERRAGGVGEQDRE
jgi:hypothetical protein